MAQRTRDRLIEVARQLFTRQGIENTTMNDIATASDRGRRTLYTYFRTKGDIYDAVIERETERIRTEIEAEVAAQSQPREKLRALMLSRLRIAMENAHGYQLWLKSIFSSDARRAKTIRAMIADRIYEMIEEIVTSGIASGDFIPSQARRLPIMLTMTVRGTDWMITQEELSHEEIDRWISQSVDFIIDGISGRPMQNNTDNENS
ncbi:MAG: TetR/AcrR family transcriptional regulator [Bacteroides sp.]|nr:TetR/AcrR family transcriptional regulator [Bacteroides sp.]MBD5373614.1 TetR/AcrR family transcriptional regulator [Bacteroides sp.]